MGLDNPLHIAFLLIVMLMVFGAKRLPEMGKSLGHGLRGFKDAINLDSPAQPMHASGEIAPPLAVEAGPDAAQVAVPVAASAGEHSEQERAAA